MKRPEKLKTVQITYFGKDDIAYRIAKLKAVSIPEALEQFKTKHPDVIVEDIGTLESSEQ